VPKLSVSTESTAAPERVWQLATDLALSAEWNTRHAAFIGDVPATLAVGATYRERVKMMGMEAEVAWRVITADAPARLEQAGDGPLGVKAHNRFVIEPAGTGSQITFEMEFNGPALPGPIAALVQKQAGAAAKESLAKFAAML
jgi:uncharacterized protein YndB with AHSA1/START domain